MLLDVVCLTESQRRSAEVAFAKIRNRDILAVFEECGLDAAVVTPYEIAVPSSSADRTELGPVWSSSMPTDRLDSLKI
jgi:predicted hydrolase (HD superfamily)